VIDPVVVELGDVWDAEGGIRLGIDNRIRNDFLPDDGQERVFGDVGNHHGVDFADALADAKDLPAAPRPRLPLRAPLK
jgi:hypothetical protein